MSDNVVISKDLSNFKILVAAPGATVKNTNVYVDKGAKCSETDRSGRVIIEVAEPELSKQWLSLTDFTVSESIPIPSQYDLDDIEVTIYGGLIIVSLHSAKDRIVPVHISE